MMSRKKKHLRVWGWDRKICPLGSPIIITTQAKKYKDLWRFDRVSAYFSDASQSFPKHKISLVTYWIGCLIRNELRLWLDRQISTTKQETLPMGVGVAKVDFTKTFRNHVKWYNIINTRYKLQWKYFKVQNHEHFNDCFVVVFFYLIC